MRMELGKLGCTLYRILLGKFCTRIGTRSFAKRQKLLNLHTKTLP